MELNKKQKNTFALLITSTIFVFNLVSFFYLYLQRQQLFSEYGTTDVMQIVDKIGFATTPFELSIECIRIMNFNIFVSIMSLILIPILLAEFKKIRSLQDKRQLYNTDFWDESVGAFKKLCEAYSPNCTGCPLKNNCELLQIRFKGTMTTNKEGNGNFKNHWIPCSERMPETRCNVLICTSNGYVHIGWWYEADKFKDMNNVQYEDVIAWQPLPEPYKE